MRIWSGLVFLLFAQEGAPTLVSVSARQDPGKVALSFSKPIEQASGDVAANYAIDNGIKVESAVRSTLDLRLVTLTVSPLQEGVTYTVAVKNVRDCSNPPLAVAADTKKTFSFVKGFFGASAAKEEPAGHAKRPPMPKFKQPVMFNTPEADPILAALQVFPRNSAWNEDITKAKVHPDSDKIIVSIGGDKTLRYNMDMAFILVPADQPKIDVKLGAGYSGESDKGPYPVPDNTPIEGWPMDGKALEVAQKSGGADRHAIVVDPANGMLYEFYQMFKRSGWEASGEATFDLKTNHMRPRGWTSSDAAGLPIFPSLPRYDEIERGAVEHALRFTVRQTRKEFIYPARHQAGRSDSPAVPAMGQRFRLKASTDLTGFSKHALAIALALKKHGMFVADNGGDWEISVPPDKRITGLESLKKLKGSDFEVVVTTGESDLGRPN